MTWPNKRSFIQYWPRLNMAKKRQLNNWQQCHLARMECQTQSQPADGLPKCADQKQKRMKLVNRNYARKWRATEGRKRNKGGVRWGGETALPDYRLKLRARAEAEAKAEMELELKTLAETHRKADLSFKSKS